MYPYLRLAKTLVKARRRPPLALGEVSVLPMRVWPGDLDAYPEQNNGRHLTLMDLGRYDYAVRCGLYRVVREQKWAFMIAGSSARFRRRLRPFQRYDLCSQVLGHDERFFYFHQFTLSGPGESLSEARTAHSSALVRGALVSRDGLVPVAEVAAALGAVAWNPPLPDWVRAWIGADHGRPWPPHHPRQKG